MSHAGPKAEELFEAARRAGPAPNLARQIVERARRELEPELAPVARWRRPLIAAGLGFAAMAAAVALVVRLQPEPVEPSPIAAEPVPPPTAVREERPRPAVPPPATGQMSLEPPPALPAKARAKNEARSLPEQLKLLEEARDALRAGAATRTLEILETYQRGKNSVDMSAEATLLRIEALVQLGRRREADALIERFVARHSDNPLVDRARSLASGRTEAVGMGRELHNEPKQ